MKKEGLLHDPGTSKRNQVFSFFNTRRPSMLKPLHKNAPLYLSSRNYSSKKFPVHLPLGIDKLFKWTYGTDEWKLGKVARNKIREEQKLDPKKHVYYPGGAVIAFSDLEKLFWRIYYESQTLFNKKGGVMVGNGLSEEHLIRFFYRRGGIYMIQNKISKKRYIGKSEHLLSRLYEYFNINKLEKNPSLINKALLKFKHSNFSFTILELGLAYKRLDIDKLNKWEQHYINIYKPQYNIRKMTYKGDMSDINLNPINM